MLFAEWNDGAERKHLVRVERQTCAHYMADTEPEKSHLFDFDITHFEAFFFSSGCRRQ